MTPEPPPPPVHSGIPDLRFVSFAEIAHMDPATLRRAMGPQAPRRKVENVSLPILPESRFSSSI